MTATTQRAPAARVLTASLVGTAVEFYDFYIYATAAALVFPALFFPSESGIGAADVVLMRRSQSPSSRDRSAPSPSDISGIGLAENPRSSGR